MRVYVILLVATVLVGIVTIANSVSDEHALSNPVTAKAAAQEELSEAKSKIAKKYSNSLTEEELDEILNGTEKNNDD